VDTHLDFHVGVAVDHLGREAWASPACQQLRTVTRQGELLALKWKDVDLNEGVIRIRRTLARSGGRIALGEPKTKGSSRPVHLTVAAVEALKTHLARQLEDIERLGDLYHDHGLVFTSEVGTLINPGNLR
jgi:integrase